MSNRKISALSEIVTPASGDALPIVDVSETADVNKNKKITYGSFFRQALDGTIAAPSIAFGSDSGHTGFYRAAADQIGISINQSNVATFSSSGFQLGAGSATAQLHLFSTDTTDQVIIENTDAGLDTAPDVVLYRNSASPADNDNLGNIEFRGRNDNNQDHAYAQILAKIEDASDSTEDGVIDIITSSAGTQSSRIRVAADRVGINEATPLHTLHVTESVAATGLFVESKENAASSAADIVLYHHRNTGAGQDADVISSVVFRSNNDASTPTAESYASIVASIVDASDTTEDGKLDLKVQSDGTLTSMVAIAAANVTLGARPIIPTLTPASATAAGTAGEVAWDANYIYVCIATNTWKRVAISTWS
tara:strand:+ start:1489 stop:2586 length:1098 start_codon:yes stop_codon:yes gene_type:complete